MAALLFLSGLFLSTVLGDDSTGYSTEVKDSLLTNSGEHRVCNSHDLAVGSLKDWWTSLFDDDVLCLEGINTCMIAKTFGASVNRVYSGCARPALNVTFNRLVGQQKLKEGYVEVDTVDGAVAIEKMHENCSYHLLNTNPARDLGVMVCLCDWDQCNSAMLVDPTDDAVMDAIKDVENELDDAFITEVEDEDSGRRVFVMEPKDALDMAEITAALDYWN